MTASGGDAGHRATEPPPLEARAEELRRASAFLDDVRAAVARRVVGRRRAVDRLLVGLVTGGHVLLEGVPGLGKTLLVRSLSDALDASFSRVQFTPDLLPADLVGTLVWQERAGEFRARKGPVFANLVLADEVNRAPAKVQSALLEAMQEGQVTIGEESHALPEPFLVMATQNPIEQEGTYPLPEAQVDRFTFKLLLDYPDRDEEREVLRRGGDAASEASVDPVASPEDVLRARRALGGIEMADEVAEYVLDLVRATRESGRAGLAELADWIEHGASPRATLHLARAARGGALLEGRPYVVPADVRDALADTLRHRVVLSYRAHVEEVTPDELLGRVLERVPVP